MRAFLLLVPIPHPASSLTVLLSHHVATIATSLETKDRNLSVSEAGQGQEARPLAIMRCQEVAWWVLDSDTWPTVIGRRNRDWSWEGGKLGWNNLAVLQLVSLEILTIIGDIKIMLVLH